MGDTLIRARHLAEWGLGAHVARGIRTVTYHHILLARHGLLKAEGAWAESLYPGREALNTLVWQDRITLARCIMGPSRISAVKLGDKCSFTFDAEALIRTYGQRCLPLLTGREARSVLSGLGRSLPQTGIQVAD
jgi:hypothetical protein